MATINFSIFDTWDDSVTTTQNNLNVTETIETPSLTGIDGASINVGGVAMNGGTVDGIDVSALSTSVSEFPAGLKSLTADEITQLLNIDTSTISIAQWGYLGTMDQSVSIGDSVTHKNVYANNQAGDATISVISASNAEMIMNMNNFNIVSVGATKTDSTNGIANSVNFINSNDVPFTFNRDVEISGDLTATNTDAVIATVGTYAANLNDLAANDITQLAKMDPALSLTTDNFDQLATLDQPLATTSSPSFAGVTLTGTATSSSDAVSKGYVDALSQGITDYQESVLARATVSGDITTAGRYILLDASAVSAFAVNSSITIVSGGSISTGTGATTFEDHNIIEVSGTPGSFQVDLKFVPTLGATTNVEGESKMYVYTVNSQTTNEEWIVLGSIINHDNLINGGSKSHATLDAHVDSTSNPHDVSIDQLNSKMHTDNVTTQAKGDLFVSDGTNIQKLAAPSNDEILVADSSTSSGWVSKPYKKPSPVHWAYSTLVGRNIITSNSVWKALEYNYITNYPSSPVQINSSGYLLIVNPGTYKVHVNIGVYLPTDTNNDRQLPQAVLFACTDGSDNEIVGVKQIIAMQGSNAGLGNAQMKFNLTTAASNYVLKVQARKLIGGTAQIDTYPETCSIHVEETSESISTVTEAFTPPI